VLNVEVWSMRCPDCNNDDMVPITLSDGTLTRWTCNFCGYSISPDEALKHTVTEEK